MKAQITIVVVFLACFAVGFRTFFYDNAHAQSNPFPPPYIECNDTFQTLLGKEEDFHSLRPFQASPCNLTRGDAVWYCGNDLIATDHVGESGEFTPSSAGAICETDGDGNITCTFTHSGTVNVSMNLTDAELPIVGNTELVPNSQNSIEPDGGPSAADLMNNYVSWYLNGTVYRAETNKLEMDDTIIEQAEEIRKILELTPEPKTVEEIIRIITKDSNGREKLFDLIRTVINYEDWNHWYDVFFVPDLSPESHTKLLAYSGPINKLLPQRIQWDYKITQINSVADRANASDTNPQARHNQIVGCTNGLSIDIPLIGTVGINFGGRYPVPCYRDDAVGIVDFITNRHRLSEWNNNLPPDENSPLYHLPLEMVLGDNFKRYYKDYREWRGDFCASIPMPITGSVTLCGPNPLNPNYYAALFPYIPYTSTEDRVGGVIANLDQTIQPSEDNVEITDIEFVTSQDSQKSDSLYFAHMEETPQLAHILQKTYLPLEEKDKGWTEDPGQQGVFNSYRCEENEARHNPGDDLFGEFDNTTQDPLSDQVTGDLEYSATFECTFPAPDPKDEEMQRCHNEAVFTCGSQFTPGTTEYNDCMLERDIQCRIDISGENIDEAKYRACRSAPRYAADSTCFLEAWDPAPCEKDIVLALSAYTQTPNVEELYERTVAGPQSIFNRIYPRALVDEMVIKDMPGILKGTYLSNNATNVQSGDPSRGRTGSNAQLFVPHLGSIQEYFLNGIQKALRPQGYNTTPSSSSGYDPNDPNATVNCNQNIPDSALPPEYLGSFKDNAIRICEVWTNRGESNGAICYNDVVSRALNTGVNPTFALAIWVHESACSNYSASELAWQDFGINNPAYPAEDFNIQYNQFLRIFGNSNPYETSYPNCFNEDRPAGWSDMEVAMEIFYLGGTNCSSFSGESYYDEIRNTSWGLLTNCPMPNNPKDMTCRP